MIDREGRIDRFKLLQSRPENLNENMEDEIKSAEHRGWNKCNSEWWKIVTEQPRVGEWIPCSERLPEEGQKVLISTNDDHVYSAEKEKNGYGILGEYYTSDSNVIAWMPMPEPYMEGAE